MPNRRAYRCLLTFSTVETPLLHMRVDDVSGFRLGVVDAVESGCFRVRIGLPPPGDSYWLRGEALFTVQHDTVTLICSSTTWKNYRCTLPGHHQLDEPATLTA